MRDGADWRGKGSKERRLSGVRCDHCGPVAGWVRFCRICGVKVCESCFLGEGCHAAAMRGTPMTHAACERLANWVATMGRVVPGNP